MLRKILIRNFQKHRKRVIEFDPLITTITGESEKGKTAILRALRWVITNQPSGGAFISHDEEECKVKLWLDDSIITRKKGKENEYWLNEQRYVSFGQGVPDPIANLLNISPLNFHQQHDAPFWLFETPGAVSRELNSIVALGAIDDALSCVASELRQVKSIVLVVKDRLRQAEEKQEELSWVKTFNEDLSTCEQLYSDSQEIAQDAARIDSVLKNAVSLTETIREASRAVFAGLQACQLGEEARQKQQEVDALAELIRDTEQADRIAHAPVPCLDRLEQLLKEAQETEREWSELSKLTISICSAEEKIEQIRKELAKAENELVEMADGQTCPVCGKEFDLEQE